VAPEELRERPLRSVLYVPASNPRAIDKARALACDVVFLDLEDAVAPAMKDAARRNAVEAVGAGGFGPRLVMIRCNHLASAWGPEDWAAAAQAGPDAVLAPKISDADDLMACERALADAPLRTGLWAMIETAKAIMNLREIGACAKAGRFQAMIVGTNDLMAELGCRRVADRAPLLPALALSVAAARANGLLVFDGVYNDFSDEAGFAAECEQGVDFGFDGKTLIHPSQVDACNRIFSPSPEKAAWAERVIAAFAAPEAEGKGAIALDGKMIERMHLVEARRVLAITSPPP
jgi:citrate lyase subunit beta / citryl-CoA lyase